MNSIKIGKKLDLKVPDGWHEVSFNTALKLFRSPELKDYEILALLCDVPVEAVRNSTDLENVSMYVNSLLFLKSLPIKNNPEFPNRVNKHILPWVNYSDKFDLGKCTVGQVEDMKYLIANKGSEEIDQLESCIDLVSIYMDGIENKEYDYSRAISNVKRYGDEIDFKTVLNMGLFFLMRLSALSNGSASRWLKVPTLARRSWLVFMSWVQRLVSMLPSIR